MTEVGNGRKEVTGLNRITKKRLRELCKRDKLYQTPELNDVLYLHYQGFQFIECLEEYTELKCLWLESNAISEIQGLENQAKLKCLFLQSNLIQRIENLQHCVQLDTLNLSQNHIRKIENCGFDVLPVLNTLNLSSNYLTDSEGLEELVHCKNLSVLDLANNRIDDILIVKIFEKMPSLKVLVLTGNPVVSKLPQYRKILTLACKELTYLDSRPVFPKDRACAEAWKRGGYAEERKENARWNRRERNKMLESVNATIRMRNRHLPSDKQEDLLTLSGSEDETTEAQERSAAAYEASVDLEMGLWDEVMEDPDGDSGADLKPISSSTDSNPSYSSGVMESDNSDIRNNKEYETKPLNTSLETDNKFLDASECGDTPKILNLLSVKTPEDDDDYDGDSDREKTPIAKPLISIIEPNGEFVECIDSDREVTPGENISELLTVKKRKHNSSSEDEENPKDKFKEVVDAICQVTMDNEPPVTENVIYLSHIIEKKITPTIVDYEPEKERKHNSSSEDVIYLSHIIEKKITPTIVDYEPEKERKNNSSSEDEEDPKDKFKEVVDAICQVTMDNEPPVTENVIYMSSIMEKDITATIVDYEPEKEMQAVLAKLNDIENMGTGPQVKDNVPAKKLNTPELLKYEKECEEVNKKLEHDLLELSTNMDRFMEEMLLENKKRDTISGDDGESEMPKPVVSDEEEPSSDSEFPEETAIGCIGSSSGPEPLVAKDEFVKVDKKINVLFEINTAMHFDANTQTYEDEDTTLDELQEPSAPEEDTATARSLDPQATSEAINVFEKENVELKKLLQKLEDENERLYNINSVFRRVLDNDHDENVKMCDDIVAELVDDLQLQTKPKSYEFTDLESDEEYTYSSPARKLEHTKTIREVLDSFNALINDITSKNREEVQRKDAELKEKLAKKAEKAKTLNALLKSPTIGEFNKDTSESLAAQIKAISEEKHSKVRKLVDKVYAQREQYYDTLEMRDGRLVVVKRDTGEVEELPERPVSSGSEYETASEHGSEEDPVDRWDRITRVGASTQWHNNYRPTERKPAAMLIKEAMERFDTTSDKDDDEPSDVAKAEAEDDPTKVHKIDEEFFGKLDFNDVKEKEDDGDGDRVVECTRSYDELKMYIKSDSRSPAELAQLNDTETELVEMMAKSDLSVIEPRKMRSLRDLALVDNENQLLHRMIQRTKGFDCDEKRQLCEAEASALGAGYDYVVQVMPLTPEDRPKNFGDDSAKGALNPSQPNDDTEEEKDYDISIFYSLPTVSDDLPPLINDYDSNEKFYKDFFEGNRDCNDVDTDDDFKDCELPDDSDKAEKQNDEEQTEELNKEECEKDVNEQTTMDIDDVSQTKAEATDMDKEKLDSMEVIGDNAIEKDKIEKTENVKEEMGSEDLGNVKMSKDYDDNAEILNGTEQTGNQQSFDKGNEKETESPKAVEDEVAKAQQKSVDVNEDNVVENDEIVKTDIAKEGMDTGAIGTDEMVKEEMVEIKMIDKIETQKNDTGNNQMDTVAIVKAEMFDDEIKEKKIDNPDEVQIDKNKSDINKMITEMIETGIDNIDMETAADIETAKLDKDEVEIINEAPKQSDEFVSASANIANNLKSLVAFAEMIGESKMDSIEEPTRAMDQLAESSQINEMNDNSTGVDESGKFETIECQLEVIGDDEECLKTITVDALVSKDE